MVCIGAGISAIALGARLKISYGLDDIAFYERDTQLGGTWHANTYPGEFFSFRSAREPGRR